jgi:hypothetical protein
MQKNINIWLSAFIIAVSFASCQRVIDVDIPNSAQLLVIEGNLTDRTEQQVVTISRSVAYNNTNVYPAVSGAKVTITDAAGHIYPLQETTKAGTYAISSLKGKYSLQYMLNVKVGDQLYTASSIMPSPVNLDSLTLSAQAFGNTTVRTVSVNYHDPINVPNQYKYVMYVNGVQVKQIFAENDNLSDGRAIASMLYQREVDLKSGDRVDVDMQCIDTNMFNYWENLSGQGGNTPANSATPANPPTNFSNNALGYFSAHTIQRKTIFIL